MGRALVIGGGVAGTATAMVLQRAGWSPTVFESYSSGGDDAGAFLTLGPNGMLALDSFGASDRVVEAGFHLHTLEAFDAAGELRDSRTLSPARPHLSGYQCLHRSELYRALQAEAIDRGVTVERDKRLVDAQRCDDGVRAVFADGTSAVGELLVGADGLRSTVRTLIDGQAPAPRYVGVRVFYGYSSSTPPGAEVGVIRMIRGSSGAFGYTVSPRGDTWWFARLPEPESDRTGIAETPPQHWRAHLEAAFGPDRTPAADIVASTDDRLFATDARDIAALPRWRDDDMVVVGDAAHPASPASGQGASMALEDAVVLGKALRDTSGRAEALEVFERFRRPRAEANVSASAALDTGRPQDSGATRPAESADDLVRLLDWNEPLDT
ncbi:2-polyprenyl-6-methoxyphenol hydroxylase-like FAD-dependent oxidoreductase [Saccharopolyspora lacisalsi]|uniref:2-polyprenyl-6-methoxyphenol hydroxylase-like FAD-dependent oxidoreductase n=1 Tax=Halosaccharopolyspora lacisalsi TaxID=1000566 RepID=A0A839E157_9PSEU|nr:NAD(P)/FAD-dependent oxidoreductase [Halosaccharopolyspora lacisalsi]MBA8826256.1 2-polyprenyl-6-methoxyphenol hydroxylase-like FAD-dependent oxidoreductase [Halosaccharopolyspora lacisalsi]